MDSTSQIASGVGTGALGFLPKEAPIIPASREIGMRLLLKLLAISVRVSIRGYFGNPYKMAVFRAFYSFFPFG